MVTGNAPPRSRDQTALISTFGLSLADPTSALPTVDFDSTAILFGALGNRMS